MLFVAQYGVCILLGRGQKKNEETLFIWGREIEGQSCCLFTWDWVNCSFNENGGLTFDEHKMSSKLDHDEIWLKVIQDHFSSSYFACL